MPIKLSNNNKLIKHYIIYGGFRKCIINISNGNFRALKPLLASGVMLLLAIFSVILNALPTYAAITLEVTSTNANFNLVPGKFNESPVITASITAEEALSGYTLTLTGPNEANKLLKTGTTNEGLESITSSGITSEAFNSNEFGIKYCNNTAINNCITNATYNVAPGNGYAEIDKTDTKNTTAVEYALAIGAKASEDAVSGDTYTGTFTILASVNPIPYNISFVDAASNIPNAMVDSTTATSVTLPSETPTKSGYIFKGWCSVYTTNNTCSGTTYQPGATYNLTGATNTTNLYAIWDVIMDLDQAFSESGKTKTESGYYAMQDMNSTICAIAPVNAEIQLEDIRDNKTYWVTKLADNHCWMTQNLDLNLSTATTLTSENTDLTSYGENGYTTDYGYSKNNNTGVISWKPSKTTLDATTTDKYNALATAGWSTSWGSESNQTTIQSMDVGVKYQVGTYFTSATCNYITSTTCANFVDEPDSVNGTHGAVGNYYSWTAAIAANSSNFSEWITDDGTYNNISANPSNSICPSNWRLPTTSNDSANIVGSTYEFGRLNKLYNGGVTGSSLPSGSDRGLFEGPLWFTRARDVYSTGLSNVGYYAVYWSSTIYNGAYAYALVFNSVYVSPPNAYHRYLGRSVRCVAR